MNFPGVLLTFFTKPLFYPVLNGGERGIRTLGGVSPTHPFQGCTIGHSVISPIRSKFMAFLRRKESTKIAL